MKLFATLAVLIIVLVATSAQPGNKRNGAKGNAGKRKVIGKGKCWQYPLFELKD